MPDAESPIDIESLLNPIPGENPCGENLLYEGLHDSIRQARHSDLDVDREEGKKPDWEQVISLSVEALASQTKDLQVAAWLGEAWIKIYGFSGFSASLKLLAGMHTLFWDGFYPEIDEGDLEARANSMAWYDRQISLGIKEVFLTDAPGSDNYSFLQWQGSNLPQEYQQIALNNPEEAADIQKKCGKASEEWARLFRDTPRQFYEETAGLLQQCRQECDELDRLMDEKLGNQTPGLADLKKALEEIREFVDRLVKEKRRLEPELSDEEASASDQSGSNLDSAIAGGAIRGRQEALKRLTEVAEYFQRTEPHSPVAYLVRRAVKWGNMPLDKWLEDIIKDTSVLNYVHETLGFTTGPEETGE